ncbi:hypothetical protein [Sinomicrobium sp.]
MDLIKKTVFTVIAIGLILPAHAQLLKKIGERAGKAVERTILNKTDQKISEKVGEGIDDAVDGKPERKKKPRQGANAHRDVTYADTYTFTHRYVMKVSGEKTGADVVLNYYLAPDVSYTGMEMNRQGMEMFTISDSKAGAMHSFISVNGNKMASTTSTRYDGEGEDDIPNDTNLLDYNITSLPDKIIAGHSCKGKQLEDHKNVIIFYYTQIKGVQLNLFDREKSQQILPGELKGLFDPDSLIMYMEITEKTGKKQHVTMECLELSPSGYTLDTRDYKKGL